MGRELLTSDEVRMLDNSDCILFIRGERPIIDKKYDILKHPKIKLTPDGGGKIYDHSKNNNAIAELVIDTNLDYNFNDLEKLKNNYEIIYSEDIDDFLEGKGKYERKRNIKKNKED